ncbi:alcohol oxidase [Mycena galericulata]|nr:alcohol oxidase [Mycena galericulata]
MRSLPRAVSNHIPSSTQTESRAAAFSKESFDFIVVGGGTSGLVVATRLAENPNIRVGVIEAGEYLPNDANINIPQGAGYLRNPSYDWLMSSVPQEGANNRSIYLARGKIVGGSTGINSMASPFFSCFPRRLWFQGQVWQRGAREDYDAWSQVIGNDKTWSFEGLLPYFKKTENWTPPTLKHPGEVVTPALEDVHGRGGAIQVSYDNYFTDIDIPCVTTAGNLGLPLISNPDGGNSTGFPLVARSVSPTQGVRSYSGTGYLTPNLAKPNLYLLTSAQVTKINFNKDHSGQITASGVEFLVGSKTYTAEARKEVILAAGSLKTPQLLELSGVGDSKLISSLGIPSILDLPQVGENLQDQPLCITEFSVREGFTTLDQLRFNATFAAAASAQYNHSHTGPLTYTPSIYGVVPLQSIVNASRLNSLLAELDAQIASTTLTPLQKVQYTFQRNLVAEGKVGTVGFTVVPVGGTAAPPAPNTSYVSVVAVAMHPFSRGSVHISSTNATKMPAIDIGYLKFDFDADLVTEGLKFNRKWSETPPFSNLIQGPTTPAANITSDADVKSFLRNTVAAHNHALGSTVMAPRNLGGVVDSSLKVYGLENVRIVDAGIIPQMITGAISATVYAVAEKASDIIKEAWNL